MSNRLPLVRSISHQIDLIHISSLSNKTSQNLTIDKNEELNRQVHKSIESGLIRQSSSPFTVPTILAPKKGGE